MSLPADAQDRRPPDEEESTWGGKPNVGYGPFHETSLSPFTSLRLNLSPYFPSALPERTFELRVETAWGKNNTLNDLWDIDFEVVASTVSFAWALSDEARVQLEIVSGDRTGGGLDALINGFHQTFGLALGVRSRHPRNDYVFDLKASDAGPAVHIDRNDPNPFVEAALFTFQHVTTFGDDVIPAVSYALTLRTKLGGTGDLQEASPVDLLGSVTFSKEIAGFHVYAGGIIGWYGRDDLFGLKLRTWQWAGQLAAEWNCLPGFSLIAQYLITGGAIEGLRDFSKPSNEVAGGFKWEILHSILFEGALIENILNFNNGPDLGFQFGFTFRY
jgi:hypothetical protein